MLGKVISTVRAYPYLLQGTDKSLHGQKVSTSHVGYFSLHAIVKLFIYLKMLFKDIEWSSC